MLPLLLALTVVIDPGHGGSNTGAPGAKPHSYEKQLTLSLAKGLATRLKSDGIETLLTRQNDTFLTLRDRARLANPEHPDLFISLHANASASHQQRGMEIYVLDPEQAYLEARRKARAQTNLPEIVLAQIDMYQVSVRSALFADAVVQAFANFSPTATRPLVIKQAHFDVLSGLHMPAALFEVGFIDHAEEGRLLFTPKVQRAIIERLSQAIIAFLATRLVSMGIASRDSH